VGQGVGKLIKNSAISGITFGNRDFLLRTQRDAKRDKDVQEFTPAAFCLLRGFEHMGENAGRKPPKKLWEAEASK
jgi:hypothetical protein